MKKSLPLTPQVCHAPGCGFVHAEHPGCCPQSRGLWGCCRKNSPPAFCHPDWQQPQKAVLFCYGLCLLAYTPVHGRQTHTPCCGQSITQTKHFKTKSQHNAVLIMLFLLLDKLSAQFADVSPTLKSCITMQLLATAVTCKCFSTLC